MGGDRKCIVTQIDSTLNSFIVEKMREMGEVGLNSTKRVVSALVPVVGFLVKVIFRKLGKPFGPNIIHTCANSNFMVSM